MSNKLFKLANRFSEKYKSVADLIEEDRLKKEQGNWFPASGGTETPFVTRTGKRLLYCWQPSTGRHAYLDLDNDLFLSDEEVRIHLP
jgi:hypothetical protein